MLDGKITHVSFGNDYGKVHRLVTPARDLKHARGTRTECGRTFQGGHGAAGYYDYDREHPWFCRGCHVALTTLRP